MKLQPATSFILALFFALPLFAQKTMSEGTITYDITILPKNNTVKTNGTLNGAKTTIYLKGAMSRTDMTSTLGTESTIYNAKAGTAAILKEYSGQKLMITLTRENWEACNKKYDNIKFESTGETKIVDGYHCKMAVAVLDDGSKISVFYTTELIAMNKGFNQPFKKLDGFPLEYQFETDKLIFKYTVSDIDFAPLPNAKFELPKTGYRVMTYEENKSGKTEKP